MTPGFQPSTEPIGQLQLLKKPDVAAALRISVRQLDVKIASREFPPGVRIGRWLYWSMNTVESWHAQQFEAQIAWRPSF